MWQNEYDVGFVSKGEWLEYTVDVEEERAYDLALRVARGTAGSGAARLEVDGADVTGSIEFPPTVGWNNWKTVTASGLNLTDGEHVIRIEFETDGIDLNWFELQ